MENRMYLEGVDLFIERVWQEAKMSMAKEAERDKIKKGEKKQVWRASSE
jgi:hypothetical protein